MSIKQAREFVANKNYLEANEEYSNAIKLDTSNSYAYFERSQIYYALKKYELALNDINIAEELNKSFSDHSINFIKGKILFNIGNIEDSIKSFEKEIKYKPENVIGILWQIRALSKYKEYDRAKIYAEKLIKIDPNSARSYSILGDILLFMGELEESDKYHALALKLDPNYKIATKTFN
jgi:tetratricopeptide (TPR) repeat protein